jgi:hypothetical protein
MKLLEKIAIGRAAVLIQTYKQTNSKNNKAKARPSWHSCQRDADGKIVNKVEFAIIPFVAQMTVYGL